MIQLWSVDVPKNLQLLNLYSGQGFVPCAGGATRLILGTLSEVHTKKVLWDHTTKHKTLKLLHHLCKKSHTKCYEQVYYSTHLSNTATVSARRRTSSATWHLRRYTDVFLYIILKNVEQSNLSTYCENIDLDETIVWHKRSTAVVAYVSWTTKSSSNETSNQITIRF